MRAASAWAEIPAGCGLAGAFGRAGHRSLVPLPVAVAADAASRRPDAFVGQALDVQQVPRRDVVGGDVAAPAAAAKRHRRIQAGRQPDRSMRRRRVHADAEGRLLQPELQDDVVVLRVDRHGVPHAAVPEDLDAALAPFPPVLDDIQRQHRAQLLDRERIVAADAGKRRDRTLACPSGTLIPTCSAMTEADFPTSAGFGSRCGVTSAFANASISAAFRKYAPCARIARRTSSATASSTTTEFGDEQSTPLSNVLPITMSLAAFFRSALRSM